MASSVGLYSKAIASAVSAGLTVAVTSLTDGTISPVEWTVISSSFLGSASLVWLVPNTPKILASYGKAGTSALVAVAGALGTGFTDGGGLSSAEIVGVLLAFLTGLGLVATVPNAAESDPVNPKTGKLVPITDKEILLTSAAVPAVATTSEVPAPGTEVDFDDDNDADPEELEPPAGFDDGSDPNFKG
jgi:hypothetical protein